MSKNGSITVEAAFVVPVVLFMIFIIIAAALFLYQKVVIVRAASFAAQQGAEVWTDSRQDINTGAWDNGEKEDPLYYQLSSDSLFSFISSSNNNSCKEVINSSEELDNLKERDFKILMDENSDLLDKKIAKIKLGIYEKLSHGLLNPMQTTIEIKYDNILIKRQVTVKISQNLKIPFGQMKEIFDNKDYITISSTSTAIVSEPTEYIRNIDLVIEYAHRIGDALNITDVIDDLKGKILD